MLKYLMRLEPLAPGARKQTGFTLIEMMVVVVVLSILAAIAIPSYRSAVLKSNRGDAKAALIDLAAREEKYFTINNQYAVTASSLGYTGFSFPIPAPLSGTTHYTIASPSVAAAAGVVPATFSATATPSGSQAADKCGSFTLNSVGAQSVTGTATSCW